MASMPGTGPAAGSGDATLAMMREINESGKRLLGSCMRLATSLPVTPLQSKAEWPELLGHFKNVGQQLAEVSSRTERHLEHAVPVPTAPAASQDGSPTMFIPELLRTKKPPEQEADEEDVRDAIAGFLPDNDREEAREEEASLRLAQFNSAIFKYNRDLDDLVARFRDGEHRTSLKRKCGETVTKFSAKRRVERSPVAIDMINFMYTGQNKVKMITMKSDTGTSPPATTTMSSPANTTMPSVPASGVSPSAPAAQASQAAAPAQVRTPIPAKPQQPMRHPSNPAANTQGRPGPYNVPPPSKQLPHQHMPPRP